MPCHGYVFQTAFTRGTIDGTILIEISDNGQGIPHDERERIFERFYRMDKARSREIGGAGLGLAIARWSVEANGGRIEVEGEVGRGSTLRVVIPTNR